MEPEYRSTVILNVGHDPTLLSTRHKVLRSAGYIVESTCSIEYAFNRLRDGDFDLVVMCHSLLETVRMGLTRCLRDAGLSVPLISVGTTNKPGLDQFADVNSSSAPRELLHNIEAFLQPGKLASRKAT